MTFHPISIVIPTYRREHVLLETIQHLLDLPEKASEIIIVDQSEDHLPEVSSKLDHWHTTGAICWLLENQPSVTHAMNMGLLNSQEGVVLFLDDDIIPDPGLVAAHMLAQKKHAVVAGQVIQPWNEPICQPENAPVFLFNSTKPRFITDLMGGNFSIQRELALQIGGFDENFVHVAYRFEADVAERLLASGVKIYFEPRASIRHLKATHGGTRIYGHHFTSFTPSHAVGEYYYLMKSDREKRKVLKIIRRLFKSISTRFHLVRPWIIPITLSSEIWGLIWGAQLHRHGPQDLNAKGWAKAFGK